MGAEYARAVEALCSPGSHCREAVAGLCQTAHQTLDQALLEGAVARALVQVRGDEGCTALLRDIQSRLQWGDYVRCGPVEFRELEEGGWEVRWRQWDGGRRRGSGPYEVRRLSPVPYMEVVVVPEVVGEAGRWRFGYTLYNRSASSRAIHDLLLEWVGQTREHGELLRQHRKHLYGKQMVGELISIVPSDASDVLRVFWLWLLRRDARDMVQQVQPGEALTIPPIFRTPWPHLPGVVRCWTHAGYWQGPEGIKAEETCQEIVDLFYRPEVEETELGPNYLPRWAYWGKTIGPVPAPEPGTPRSEWIGQLLKWHEDAVYWGWYEEDGAERWGKYLEELAADPAAERIRRLLEQVEEDRRAGRLLEETYALWRYNLEFLRELPEK